MARIFGYGEDAFTLWALKNRKSDILKEFDDKTPPDCIVFYRPSFGRGDGAKFGEFDGIIVSTENIYLIESKRDNFSKSEKDTINLEPCQELRHSIFSWYLQHWDEEYTNRWESFERELGNNFQKNFKNRRIAPTGSLLASNLEFVLIKLQKHLGWIPAKQDIKNVLLFFYDKDKSTSPVNVPTGFTPVSIDYGQEITGNFISLEYLNEGKM